jgi:peptide/nickel transport system substrate-binding protein
MPVPQRLTRTRPIAALLLALSVLLPAAAPAAAADPVVLRVGTTQDLLVSNPWNSTLVVDYEAFQLTYDLLLNFDKDAKPGPGFADSWERDAEKVTFHIRDGMKWSDGEPATSADVCFSWGLAMDAIAADSYIGNGYLDPDIKNSGVTKIECPDDSTFVAYTTDPSDRVLQTYVPIIPKHVWGDYTYETIAEQKFDAPLVGTGPYTLAEWKIGQFARFVRNPNYWGEQGFADEVVLQFFPDATDTMVQALKAGDIDYVHNVNPDQFKQLQADPAYTAVEGAANGWTQIAFNTYGTGTDKTIEDGGPSTKALLDPKFRDALGYAIDKDALVERVLGGFGDKGTTAVPPILSDWHVEPTTPRTFDIELAKQKLEAAGYTTNSDGKRLDKEGKPIALRVIYPNTHDVYAKSAQFVQEWYGQLGIDVSLESLDSDTVTNRVLPPEGDPPGKADYDIEIWGWSGSPDPSYLVSIFTCDEVGVSSDSQYCNPAYDELYEKQLTQAGEERKATLAEMQNILYDEAPYDILFYDSYLDVYRNDRFAGWQNMPSQGGIPLFTYGTLDYTLLTDATAQPSPTPAAESASPSDGASAEAPSSGSSPEPTDAASGGGTNTGLLLAVVAVVVVVVAGGLLMARRRSSATGGGDDDE